MPVSDEVTDWAREFVVKELELKLAAMTGSPGDYQRVRTEMFSSFLIDEPSFSDYKVYYSETARQNPSHHEFVRDAKARIVSLIRSYADDAGDTWHRVYLGEELEQFPDVITWSNVLLVQPTLHGLRGVALFFSCGRCKQSGNFEGYRCPYCNGDRWIQNGGAKQPVHRSGRVTRIVRLKSPILKTERPEYDSDEGLPPVRDLPPYPREIG